MGVHCEGVSGAIAKPPTRLRRGEIPALRIKVAMVARPAIRSRPSGATQHSCWIERLGGRVCGRAKLGAGTLRCLHLGGLFPLSRFDEEQLGRCPKPQQGRRPCTLQGALPLDPFWLPSLSTLAQQFFSAGYSQGTPSMPLSFSPVRRTRTNSPCRPLYPSGSVTAIYSGV